MRKLLLVSCVLLAGCVTPPPANSPSTYPQDIASCIADSEQPWCEIECDLNPERQWCQK